MKLIEQLILGLRIGQGYYYLLYYFVTSVTMTLSIFIIVSKGKERIFIRMNYIFVRSINIDPCCRATHLPVSMAALFLGFTLDHHP